MSPPTPHTEHTHAPSRRANYKSARLFNLLARCLARFGRTWWWRLPLLTASLIAATMEAAAAAAAAAVWSVGTSAPLQRRASAGSLGPGSAWRSWRAASSRWWRPRWRRLTSASASGPAPGSSSPAASPPSIEVAYYSGTLEVHASHGGGEGVLLLR